MIGRFLYGVLFTIALPALLVLWAWRLELVVALTAVQQPWIGAALWRWGWP